MSGEHRRARAAFDRYWHLGADRSIERLRAVLIEDGERVPSIRTLYEWSRRYGWQRRIQELEREAAVAEHEQRIREIREMRERQVREGLLLQQQGTTWLAALDVERVSAGEATRAITEGARLERDARGVLDLGEVASPRTDVVAARLAEMSDEQLNALVRQLEETRDG